MDEEKLKQLVETYQMARKYPRAYPYQPTPQPYPDKWSNVEVKLKNGENVVFMIKAVPSITKHLVQEMRDNGFLHLHNTNESLVVAASEILALNIIEITKEE
jgi:hypothetical protein